MAAQGRNYDEAVLQILYDSVNVTICKKHRYVTFDHTDLLRSDDSELSLLFSQVFIKVLQHANVAFQERPISGLNGMMYGRFLDRFYFWHDNDSDDNRSTLEEMANVLRRFKQNPGSDKRVQAIIQFLSECMPYIASESAARGFLSLPCAV